MKQPLWKRSLDLGLAVPGLIALSPLLFGTALTVRLLLGSPVLFTQERPGLHEALFRVFKFRTMRDAIDAEGQPIPDDQRITRFGRILRATSIDELPQLLNVVRGEMSLIGPRPLLVGYLPFYSPDERARFLVLPGITGLAQVEGRNVVPWDRRLWLDAEYVRRRSLWLDLRILAATVGVVVFRKGVRAVNVPTADMNNLDVERRDAPWVRRP